MNNNPAHISGLKKMDLGYQFLAAIVAACLLKPFPIFAPYILGATHAISTIFWAFRPAEPRLPARTFLQAVNLIVIATLGVLALYCYLEVEQRHRNDFWLLVSVFMLFAGPLLGLGYFVLTGLEISYYKWLATKDQPEA